MIRKIKIFFKDIDYLTLGKSTKEVLWLTSFAFFPILFNLAIASIQQGFVGSMKHNLIPGEILTFCLSFLAPTLYLLVKTHGLGYKLPFLHTISIISIFIYVLSILLYVIAKHGWSKEINMEKHQNDPYLSLSLIFLFISILFRLYSVYHNSCVSTYAANRANQQEEVNSQYSKHIRNES